MSAENLPYFESHRQPPPIRIPEISDRVIETLISEINADPTHYMGTMFRQCLTEQYDFTKGLLNSITSAGQIDDDGLRKFSMYGLAYRACDLACADSKLAEALAAWNVSSCSPDICEFEQEFGPRYIPAFTDEITIRSNHDLSRSPHALLRAYRDLQKEQPLFMKTVLDHIYSCTADVHLQSAMKGVLVTTYHTAELAVSDALYRPSAAADPTA